MATTVDLPPEKTFPPAFHSQASAQAVLAPVLSCGPVIGDDLGPPEHMRRQLPPRRRCLPDQVSRRIAQLLHLHPKLDQMSGGFNLFKSSVTERAAVLAGIEKQLGVV